MKPSSTSARSGNDNQLLIQALTPATKSPLLALAKRIADAGCNLSESRISTIGTEISLMLLASLRTNFEIFTDPLALPDIWHWENYAKAWRGSDLEIGRAHV